MFDHKKSISASNRLRGGFPSGFDRQHAASNKAHMQKHLRRASCFHRLVRLRRASFLVLSSFDPFPSPMSSMCQCMETLFRASFKNQNDIPSVSHPFICQNCYGHNCDFYISVHPTLNSTVILHGAKSLSFIGSQLHMVK